MNLPHKLAASAVLLFSAGSAWAQGNPGGGVIWFAAGVAVGFVVGYMMGKKSAGGGGGDGGGDGSGDKRS